MPVVVSGVPGKEGGDNIKQGVFSLHPLFVCWLLFLCILVVLGSMLPHYMALCVCLYVTLCQKKNLEHF